MSAARVKPFLIVNPEGANGRARKRFEALAPALRAELGEFDWQLTRARGDAVGIAREAAARSRLVVAVGGDGTASEVVDGLVEDGAMRHPELAFGYVPCGTGGDLQRTLACPADPARAARALARGVVRACDVGLLDYVGPDGRPRSRHFVNVADAGVGGVVAREVDRGLAKALGGKLSYLLASARALLSYRDQPVRWRLDGGEWREEVLTALSVCNGRYFGSGMLVAPEARVDDGLFDVVVWKGLGLVDLATKKRRLYDGTHVELPNTRVFRAREVEIEPAGEGRMLLDVDGEQPGSIPARFRMLPGALRVKVEA
jgi:diacylglycerol kinase (ATP)